MSIDPEQFPYDTVVYIDDVIGGQHILGSGVLVSPAGVLTASHVVWSSTYGTASNIVVTPGYNAGMAPYGSASGSEIHYFKVQDSNDSISLAQSETDYAVIHLSSPFPTLGYMGVAANFPGGEVHVTGYPASLGGVMEDSQQYTVADPLYSLLDGTSIGAGSSGGPVWITDASGSPDVVGIVSSGRYTGGPGYFTEITTSVLNQIKSWLAQDDGTPPTQPPTPPPTPKEPAVIITSYSDTTQIVDAGTGSILQSLPPSGSDAMQFLTADAIKYGRNLPSAQSLGLDPSSLRDYDGNNLGNASGWNMLGLASVRVGSTPSYILLNSQSGRWAEVGVKSDNSINMNNYGANGDTRVVGIYVDPLVEAGIVQKGSATDSQARFLRDVQANRFAVLGSYADPNEQGLQDLFFKLTDHSADHHDDVYLRAILWGDGNIKYANYMNTSQFTDWANQAGMPSGDYNNWLTKV